MKMFFHTAYDGLNDSRSVACGMRDDQARFPSKAVQSSKDECDINVIMKKFGVTGVAPQVVRAPRYGDFEGISDFHTAMNVIRQAEESFMELPADVRARFNNDPQALLQFCADHKNKDEMIKLGLAFPDKDGKMASTVSGSPGKEKPNVKSGSADSESGASSSEAASGGSGKAGK